MPTPTYCTRADIEAAWNPAAVLAAADDDNNGSLSSDEEAHIARAIERAAGWMHAYLEVRYPLADLIDNAWCRDCNAALAAYLLALRQGDDISAGIQAEYERYVNDLAEIRDGRQRVPQVTLSREHAPTVSSFVVDLREPRAKIRRVPEISTGSPPPDDLLNFPVTD